MKVLLANKFFFRNGGSEVVLFQERDFLLAAGHEVVDFSMRDTRNLPSPCSEHFVENHDYRGAGGAGVKIRTALSLVHSFEAVGRIKRLIRETRPDLVHCHNIYHQLTPSIIGAAKDMGVPVVLTLHDSKPVCPTYNRLREGKPCSECLGGDFSRVLRHRCADGSLGKSALLFLEASVQRWLGNYEKVDAFIAPSQFMKEAISHRVPAGRVSVLYNGVDTKGIEAASGDEGYALYLGRLSQEKGVETLLRAHEAADGGWALHVAGTGPLEPDLRARYAQARFLGHLSGEALAVAIKGAALIVVPSECYENCPMSVLEAMAHGKAVVASRMGGIPELVADGETGMLFEAGDSAQLGALLDQLMGAPELRRAMGRAARARAEAMFSMERHNAGLMEIYREVV
jgi:glycosyltransferase involved in cell wall biosynthesis